MKLLTLALLALTLTVAPAALADTKEHCDSGDVDTPGCPHQEVADGDQATMEKDLAEILQLVKEQTEYLKLMCRAITKGSNACTR